MAGMTLPKEPKRKPPKYERMRQELRHRIMGGQYPVGTKLPSVRQLCKEFGVSSATAFRSVQELAKEELVSCNVGRGGTIVISDEPASRETARKTLACLLRSHSPRNEVDNFGLDIMQGIRDAISARGYRFVYHCFDETDYEARMLELVREPWVGGIILDQYTRTTTVERLSQFGLPVVIFNRFENVDNVSVVTPDYERIGRRTLRLLIERGYERIGLHALPRDDGLDRKRAPGLMSEAGFLLAASEAGYSEGDIVRIPHIEPGEETRAEPARFGLPAHKPPHWKRLGLFAATDTMAKRIVDLVARTDLVLGRDVGIVGCFDLACNRNSDRPFSTWRIDGHAVGTETVRELFAKIESPDRPRTIVKLSAEFVDRGSA